MNALVILLVVHCQVLHLNNITMQLDLFYCVTVFLRCDTEPSDDYMWLATA
jgi:hypothetical protein